MDIKAEGVRPMHDRVIWIEVKERKVVSQDNAAQDLHMGMRQYLPDSVTTKFHTKLAHRAIVSTTNQIV